MAYDVGTKLGVPWHAAPSVYGWAELANFARHLPEDSATWRAQHPDLAPWATMTARARVATDTFDAIAAVAHMLATRWSRRPPKGPEPYPAPWARGRRGTQAIGRGAIPVEDFDKWYYQE